MKPKTNLANELDEAVILGKNPYSTTKLFIKTILVQKRTQSDKSYTKERYKKGFLQKI